MEEVRRRFGPQCYGLAALIALATCSLTIGANAGADSVNASPSPGEVVERYLQAWVNGDLETMHSLWDSRSRRAVTLEDLRNAFIVQPASADTASAPRRGQPRLLIAGRPSLLVGWTATQTGTGRAEADLVAEYTAGSETGLDMLFLHADKLELKPTGSDDDSRGWMLAVAAEALLQPNRVDTARKQSHVFSGTVGSRTIGLHLRRYALVKEADGWRISNAVTSQKKPVTLQAASRRR